MPATLLVIDNYDSFTFNLVQMFRQYPLSTTVVRADKMGLEEIIQHPPDYILISPGPKGPRAAGISTALIKAMHCHTPILGVCLGMQCLNEAFGGTTVMAPQPIHGKTSLIQHCGRGIFNNVPSPLQVARYHSLAAANVPATLEITATTDDNVIMGLSHRSAPLHGVQFHPESFLTEHGFSIIENFLNTGSLNGQLP
ncbi:MAG: aminodeoxychorismate/anthranilate synthase component II [Deltaproteobacteria bacterium]|nr:aminodeoxychorismate/anthranilate synthase component II [Deltaproteobacteria bacterium]